MNKIIIYSLLIFFLSSSKQNISGEYNSNSIASKFDENKRKECRSSEISVYLNDPDKSGTNIRRTPKGEIITKLIVDEHNLEYSILVTEAKNGWLKS